MDFSLLKRDGNTIISGVSADALEKCESSFGASLPDDYKALLRFSDGCMVLYPTFVIFFSCGVGFHEKETIEYANALIPDSGIFFIGRFAGDMFGYRKGTADPNIYSYFEEEGSRTLIATNLEDFFSKYLMPGKRKGFFASLFS